MRRTVRVYHPSVSLESGISIHDVTNRRSSMKRRKNVDKQLRDESIDSPSLFTIPLQRGEAVREQIELFSVSHNPL